jgi:sulfur carrier protein ThiS
MTVAELIEQLQSFERDSIVMVEFTDVFYKREDNVKDLMELDEIHVVKSPRGKLIVLANSDKIPKYLLN